MLLQKLFVKYERTLMHHYRQCRKAYLALESSQIPVFRNYYYFWWRYHLRKMREGWASEIVAGAELSDSVDIRHALCIVIGGGARIGEKVVIHKGVTIGALRFEGPGRRGVPAIQRIGKGTILCDGCKVLGDVTIGENCVIGAGAIVTKDIPDNSVVVGFNRILEKKTERPASLRQVNK